MLTIFYFQIDELTMIHEALTSLEEEQWKETMESEYLSLLKNQTWKLETLPPSQTSVSCKWVLKRNHPNGTISQYKVRLVAHGFIQTQIIDYGETFSPIVKIA